MPTSGLQGRRPAANEPAESETVLLWGQVALAAAVPLALMLCQLGLAVGDPVLSPALEVGLLGALPISALIWVQWRRPFYPFQIGGQYQAPEALTERQRRWLSRLLPLPHQPWLHPHGWLAVVSGGLIYVGFRQLYATAPTVEAVALLPPYLRLLGVLWAVAWVMVATVLLQGAVTAARLLWLLGEEEGPPLGVDQVRRKFTFWGQEGGAVLKVLGVPRPIDHAGRAVVESASEDSAAAIGTSPAGIDFAMGSSIEEPKEPPIIGEPKARPETSELPPVAAVPGTSVALATSEISETSAISATSGAPPAVGAGEVKPTGTETLSPQNHAALERSAESSGSPTGSLTGSSGSSGSSANTSESPSESPSANVAVEPLATPVFVNIVDSTP